MATELTSCDLPYSRCRPTVTPFDTLATFFAASFRLHGDCRSPYRDRFQWYPIWYQTVEHVRSG